MPWCLGGVPPGTEYHGQVTFGGLPAPGATVTATQGGKQLVTITDQQGLYSFPDLADGKWTIEVEMTGFAIIKQEIVIGPNTPAGKWELKLLPLDQIKAQIKSSSGTHIVAGQAKSEQAKPMDSRLRGNDEQNNENAEAPAGRPQPTRFGRLPHQWQRDQRRRFTVRASFRLR